MTNSEEASADAVHKTKNAQAAIEIAREVQMQEIVEKTAIKTKESLLEGLKEVFGDGSTDNEKMTVIHSKIPILCVRMNAVDANLLVMKEDVSEIKDNLKWGVRVVLGAVVVGVITLFFKYNA